MQRYRFPMSGINNALRQETEEMLRIHRRLLYEAQMIQEGFPKMMVNLDKEIAAIYGKKNTLQRRFDSSESEIVRLSKAIKEDENKLQRQYESPPTTRKQETTAAKIARLRRQLRQLEKKV